MSSLAYAEKTNELGVNNIHYAQADILDLNQHPTRYDIVESIGVLHHMEAPEDGLAILKDLLNPGGLLRIGLYSEYARKGVIKSRNLIKKSTIRCNRRKNTQFQTVDNYEIRFGV